jgi:hypothetical protein
MELILPLIFITLQFFLAAFVIIQLIRGMIPAAAERKKLHQSIIIIDFALTLLMLFSFVSYEVSSFNNEPYFSVFTALVLIGIVAFWLSKSKINLNVNMQNITQIMLGIFCWLSIFTAIKFYPYYPYAWFPFLGILALGPIFFTFMSLQEMIQNFREQKRVHPLLNLSYSLLFLFIFQLVLNGLTTESWVLIKIFNPENTFV